MTVLAITVSILERAILLRQQKALKLGDSLIAAAPLEAGIPLLLTRNDKDFAHVTGLRVVNPIDTPVPDISPS